MSPKTILAVMERVADWELAHPDKASVPLQRPRSVDPLGWIVGTFYTGLTALADRSSNPHYADAISVSGRRRRIGAWAHCPFHADDYEVAQNWVWAYQRKHDPRMIAAVRQRFDAIMAAHLSDSLLMVPASRLQVAAVSAAGAGAMRCSWRRWAGSRLSQAMNDPRYLAYADKEFRATTALLFDPGQSLYYRDSSYFGKTGPHGEKVFWSRGNGWVYAAPGAHLGHLAGAIRRRGPITRTCS